MRISYKASLASYYHDVLKIPFILLLPRRSGIIEKIDIRAKSLEFYNFLKIIIKIKLFLTY